MSSTHSLRSAMWDKILLTLLFSCLMYLCVFRNSQNLGGVIWSDTEGYYMYLPALIIQKDLHNVHRTSMDYRLNEKGEIIMKYTCGVAICYLPFFLGAHAYALLTGAAATGLSNPYIYGLMLCGVFWGLLGAYALLRLLSRHFSRLTAWLTVIAVILGTNYFFYVTKYMGMSHIYSFTIVVWLILLFDKYYSYPTLKTVVISGLLMGLLILIRPTNSIVVLFLLLYNITSFSQLKQRIAMLMHRPRHIAAWAVCTFITFIPQLLYWKEMTGNWIMYSYKGEGFIYWKNPKILEVLADTQNGLFLYAPVLILFVAGLFVSPKDKRTQVAGVTTTFVLCTYMFASWWAWFFGAAYGHRCYIEYFPILAFPMAIFIEKIRSKGITASIVLSLLLMLFVIYNVGLTRVNDYNFIWDGEKWRWNWPLFNQMVNKIPDYENWIYASLIPNPNPS